MVGASSQSSRRYLLADGSRQDYGLANSAEMRRIHLRDLNHLSRRFRDTMASIVPKGHQEYSRLSLNARLAVALHCFENYCRVHGLRSSAIDAFLDYMWEHPCIASPNEFTAWERARIPLVSVGLGDPFPPDVEQVLQQAGVSPKEFRELLENTVEIVFGSFYGAADDQGSIRHLEAVLSIATASAIVPPSAAMFAQSLFADRHGWGQQLSRPLRDAWRHGRDYRPMPYRTSLSAQIATRLQEYINSEDAHFRTLAQHLGALPIYADLGGYILLRPDGELLFVDIDQDPQDVRVMTTSIEPRWRTLALVVGSEKYPELRELLPVRPNGAQDCRTCGGRGRVDPTPEVRGLWCGECHGLGWVSDGSANAGR